MLKTQPLHGYAIAQRIHLPSRGELCVEELVLSGASALPIKAG